MRRLRSRSGGDVDMVDVVLGDGEAGDSVEIILDEDEADDEFLALLHELALEAIALRAHSPGDPRPEEAVPRQAPAAANGRVASWLVRRLGTRRLVRWAVIAAAALAVAIAVGVVDARRVADRRAALVAGPGVLEPATGPPVELWRLPGRVVGEQAGQLLVADATGASLLRVDPATGRGVEILPDALGVGDLTLDLMTGEELVVGPGEPTGPEEYALPGGAQATWSWDPDGSSGHGSVTRKDGGHAFALWGPPLVPAVTDGSEAGTLVVMAADGGRLVGRDLRTGRSRWSVPYVGAVPAHATALVEGVMLLDDGAEVIAIDVRTGAGLWREPVSSGVTRGSALTDGDVVLLPVREGGAVRLVARRIADGAELWRSGTPPGTVRLSVVDHLLVASTDDAVVGLGAGTGVQTPSTPSARANQPPAGT